MKVLNQRLDTGHIHAAAAVLPKGSVTTFIVAIMHGDESANEIPLGIACDIVFVHCSGAVAVTAQNLNRTPDAAQYHLNTSCLKRLDERVRVADPDHVAFPCYFMAAARESQ